MPGIVGIVAPQGKDNLDASLESMVQPMLRHDWFTIEKKVATMARTTLNCFAVVAAVAGFSTRSGLFDFGW